MDLLDSLRHLTWQTGVWASVKDFALNVYENTYSGRSSKLVSSGSSAIGLAGAAAWLQNRRRAAARKDHVTMLSRSARPVEDA
jgi:hypothetical protein